MKLLPVMAVYNMCLIRPLHRLHQYDFFFILRSCSEDLHLCFYLFIFLREKSLECDVNFVGIRGIHDYSCIQQNDNHTKDAISILLCVKSYLSQ